MKTNHHHRHHHQHHRLIDLGPWSLALGPDRQDIGLLVLGPWSQVLGPIGPRSLGSPWFSAPGPPIVRLLLPGPWLLALGSGRWSSGYWSLALSPWSSAPLVPGPWAAPGSQPLAPRSPGYCSLVSCN